MRHEAAARPAVVPPPGSSWTHGTCPHSASASVRWTKSTSADRGWNESALSAALSQHGDAPGAKLNR